MGNILCVLLQQAAELQQNFPPSPLEQERQQEEGQWEGVDPAIRAFAGSYPFFFNHLCPFICNSYRAGDVPRRPIVEQVPGKGK